jgi:hypothetical protein
MQLLIIKPFKKNNGYMAKASAASFLNDHLVCPFHPVHFPFPSCTLDGEQFDGE